MRRTLCEAFDHHAGAGAGAGLIPEKVFVVQTVYDCSCLRVYRWELIAIFGDGPILL